MLRKWVTQNKRSLKTVVMLGLRNDASQQTNFLASQLTSCFMLGRGHHTVRHKGCPVESKATGTVGFNSTWDNSVVLYHKNKACIHCAAALFGLLHVLCIKLCCWVFFADSHIFTMGFVVSSQQMWIVCPGMVFVERSSGASPGPSTPHRT